MGALRGRQAEGGGDRLENLERRPDVARLLEPCVPGGADPRDLRDLLAAEARRSAPAAGSQAHVRGLQARAAPAQEVGELGTAMLAVGGRR